MILIGRNYMVVTSFTLKIIAVVAMTFDHIGAFFPNFPIQFRWVGRLAIPIFMFLTIEGFQHTTDRKAYMKRLYLAGIVTQTIFMLVGWSHSFITVLFILTVILWIISEENSRNRLKYFLLFFSYQGFMLLVGFTFLTDLLFYNAATDFCSFLLFEFPLGNFLSGVSISILAVIQPNQVLILTFGVLIYLTMHKKTLLITTGTLFGISYFILTTTDFLVRVISKLARMGFYILPATMEYLRHFVGLGYFDIGGNPMTENFQWMMVFALPILLLYNGEKGKSGKKFFYIYYPVHILALTWISSIS